MALPRCTVAGEALNGSHSLNAKYPRQLSPHPDSERAKREAACPSPSGERAIGLCLQVAAAGWGGRRR